MLEFLPRAVKNAIEYLNAKYLYEIRIRAEKPITVNYNGRYRYLGRTGLTERAENALIPSFLDVADCVYKASEYSIYAVEEELKQGFLTVKGGFRIGIAGEYVFDKGKPLSIRNITSLCVRIPHEIYGSGEEIYRTCMCDRVKNLLIMSAPGLGKTTILRDLARMIGQNTMENVLICDERGEIGVGEVGKACDIIKYADKVTAFDVGIRALRPNIIITDELSERDCPMVEKAICAGVTVLASAHIATREGLKKPFLGLFERYVLLTDIGKIAGIYNECGEECTK
jgi:stage III sporulation protein AA